MTAFQKNAADKIRHIGGSIYYTTDKQWADGHGQRVFVPSEDFKTEGFVGWPTIQALIDVGVLYHRLGNQYSLTSASDTRRAA